MEHLLQSVQRADHLVPLRNHFDRGQLLGIGAVESTLTDMNLGSQDRSRLVIKNSRVVCIDWENLLHGLVNPPNCSFARGLGANDGTQAARLNVVFGHRESRWLFS